MRDEQLARLAVEELRRVRPAVGYPVAPRTLTDAERAFVQDTAAGLPPAVEPGSTGEWKVHASLVRDLLLGEVHDRIAGARYTTHSRGVELRNALVVGDDGELDTLDVSECSNLRPLTLIDCHLGGIAARHASVDGAVLIQRCRLDRGVDLYGFQCGSIDVDGGHVGVLPEDGSRSHVRAEGEPVAIDAGHGDFRGDVSVDDVELCGAISLMDARARYLRLRKVTIRPAGSDQKSIRNSVVADRMTVHGSVHITGCSLKVGSADPGGAIRFAGATVGSQFILRDTDVGRNTEGGSAVLQNTKIGGQLVIGREEDPESADAPMVLSGDIDIADSSASRIAIENVSARCVQATGVAARAGMTIGPGAVVTDLVEASGCRVGKFALSSCHIGRVLDRRDDPGLLLRNATILGDLHIGPGTQIRRMTDLHNIHVEGDVLITGPRPIGSGSAQEATCHGHGTSAVGPGGPTVLSAGRQGCALAADFASIRGALHVDQAKIDGSLTWESADVGQVCLSRSEVGAHRGHAVNANRSEVRGPLVLGPRLTTLGPVRIEDATAGFVDVCARVLSAGDHGDHGECGCEPSGSGDVVALSLARTKVASDVCFRRDVMMDGALSVFASRIGGSLELDGSWIGGNNDEGNSVLASRIQVENNLRLGGGFRSTGGISIRAGQIGGHVIIGGTMIGANELGFSILASFLSTGRGISLRGTGAAPLDLGGAIDLRNTSTKDLAISDVKVYADQTGTAVMCDGVAAVRSISLERVWSAGKVSLAQCEAANLCFTGSISVDGTSHCTGLDLSRASITHHVDLNNLRCRGHVKMREAVFGDLAMAYAEVTGTPECRHRELGKSMTFSLDATGIEVKNNLDISHLSAADSVFITDGVVGRTLSMMDLSRVDGRLWLSGTTVETVIFLDQPVRVDQVVVPGATTF